MPNFEITPPFKESNESFRPSEEDISALAEEGEQPASKIIPRKKIAKLAKNFVAELEKKEKQPELFRKRTD